MTLQNRVTPFGEIIADPARGTLMGNRGGRIHTDARQLTQRRWASRAWICCVLEFNNRHRQIMMPGRYTELFFLDEVTALAAGHRPCFECRYKDALNFLNLHATTLGLPERLKVDEFDRLAQAARLNGRAKRTCSRPFSTLPDGAMIVQNGKPWAVRGRQLLAWSPEKYQQAQARPGTGDAEVLTPAPFLDILAAGYSPEFHQSTDLAVQNIN